MQKLRENMLRTRALTNRITRRDTVGAGHVTKERISNPVTKGNSKQARIACAYGNPKPKDAADGSDLPMQEDP